MARKLCISLSKGGVSKSSSSISISHGLALSGKKVLLVDTDDQGQDSFLLGCTPPFGLSEVILNDMPIEEAIFPARENLWILAGGKKLAAAKREIGRKEFGAERTLSQALNKIENQFDYIIIDTSPAWDALTINSLFYADEVLSPVSLEALSLNSLAEFSKSLSSVQAYNTKLKHRYILPTFYDRRVKKSTEILSLLKKHFPDQICEPIKYNVRLSECAGHGKTIFEYAPDYADDYRKMVERIINDEKGM